MHFSGFSDTNGIVDNDSVKCLSCKSGTFSIYIHSGTMMAFCTGTKAAILHYHFSLNATLPTSHMSKWFPNSITVEGHIIWVIVTLMKCVSIKSQWLTYTGHHDLNIDNQLHSKRNNLHSVNQSPFGLALVIFHPLGPNDDHPTLTLHPTHGMQFLSLTRKDTYWVSITHVILITLKNSPYTTIHITAILTFPFSVLTSEPKILTSQQLPQRVSP